MGLIQRKLEENGISTVGVSITKEISLRIKPPRTLFLPYPFGHPFGAPFQENQHRAIFKDLLHILETATKPGIMIESPYRWRRTKFD